MRPNHHCLLHKRTLCSNINCITMKSCKSSQFLSGGVAFVLLALPVGTHARSWRDIELVHSSNADFHTSAQYLEIDPVTWYASLEPTKILPTGTSAQSPHTAPTQSPQTAPTRTPFDPDIPSSSPLAEDSAQDGSTAMYLPDSERFPESPVPLYPPRGYFDYDVQDSALYGPGYPAMIRGDDGFQIMYENNAWKFAQTPNIFDYREFTSDGYGTWNGVLSNVDFTNNQCGNVGMQSPIDIRMSGVACVEHHQIRTLPGDFRVSGSSVEKIIKPNKLRLLWQRRPCADLLDSRCAEPDPPQADFPNGWGGSVDLLHADWKLPSEHVIYGETFDAEMQLFHVHPGRQRIAAISVLIRAEPGGHNEYLQAAIDAFQYEYDLHRGECGNKIRNNRQLVTDFHKSIMGEEATNSLLKKAEYENWAEYSTLLDDPEFLNRGKEYERKLSSEIWNPYHIDLIPTYWFYGYDGSLTEPPCTEVVSWFVMDTPMIISPEQLDQMKIILFTHVDANCQSTSTHFNGSVARPIQESSGRQVWRCTRDDYPPDAERSNRQ